MKKYIFLSFFLSLGFQFSFAQTSPSEQLAQRIANKMKDTLALTAQQTQAVYIINLNLHTKKMQARTLSTDRVIVGKAIQGVEQIRDSLYKIGFTPTQYQLYVQKKRNLINSN